jgi:hypothetical protein
MTTTVASVIAVAILALLAGVAFFRYRGSASVKLHGPGNIGLDLKASNDHSPGIVVEDAVSHQGGLRVEEGTGTGAQVRRVETDADIQVTTRPPNDPKAKPR